MFVLKRKQVVIVCLALLVVMAGYLNWSYQRNDEVPASSESLGEIHLVTGDGPSDFFEAARLDREASRAEAIETLQSVIESESTEASSKALAEERVISIATHTDAETTIESLIRAKGYEDAVVYIGDESVNAVVKADTFEAADATMISEIITEQTGVAVANIKITQAQ